MNLDIMAFPSMCLMSLILCCFPLYCAADEYGDGRGDGGRNGLNSPSLFQQQQNMADLCRNCVINHGVGFAAYPGRCGAYVQCKFYGDVPTSMNIMRCPSGLYWNQNLLNCDWPDNVQCVDYDNCPNRRAIPGDVIAYELFSGSFWSRVPCPNGLAYNDITCDCTDQYQQATENPQDRCRGYTSIPGDQTGFLQRSGNEWVRMPCPTNLIYNEGICTCVRSSEEIVTARPEDQSCRPKVQLLFDGSVEDTSVNNFWINNTGVAVRDGSGVFTGTNKLTIPGLSNMDLGQTLYVRIRFQQDRTNAMQTLIANGDCEVQPSVSICSNSNTLQASVMTSADTNPTTLQDSQNINSNQWQDVLFMVDNQQTQILTLNGNAQYPTPIQSSILRRPRGLVVGGGGSCEYFTGLIDEVEVFTCRPEDL